MGKDVGIMMAIIVGLPHRRMDRAEAEALALSGGAAAALGMVDLDREVSLVLVDYACIER